MRLDIGRHQTSGVKVALVLMCLAVTARADVSQLASRVPSHTNAIVAVDVDDMRKAPGPVGAASTGAAGAPRSPVPLPKVGGLQSLVLAAHVNTQSLEPAWEVALLELSQKPSMQAVALTSGGFIDSAAGRPAVWSANDTYCISMDDRTLAVVHPADRQFAARWVERPATASNPVSGISSYLRAAAAQAKPGTPVIVAVDLKDAISEAGVRRDLDSDRPAWAAKLPADNKALSALLASVAGVTVRIGSIGTEGAAGTMVVDFGSDTAALDAGAKDLVLGVIASVGLGVPDLSEWQFAAAGKTVTGEGRLTVDGIERLLSFLNMPEVSAPEVEGGPGLAQAAGAKNVDPKQAKAQASQAYFKAVSGILDSFRLGTSFTESASWLARNAKRIDQLPVTNVDLELIEWGAFASAKLRECAAIMTAGQQRVRARTSGVQLTAAYATNNGDPDPQYAAQARADRENARRQAKQAGDEERAAVIQEASKPLQDALESRGKVRAELSERYGNAF